ncbi:MAG: hypothetical protein ACFFF4_03215 [Candidatus Thorarchaeota archaeon]
MKTLRIVILLIISFGFLVSAPVPVEAPPAWTYFKIGAPIDMENNLSMSKANITIDVTPTTNEDEDYLFSVEVNGTYIITSTNDGAHLIAVPLPMRFVIESSTEFFLDGESVDFQAMKAATVSQSYHLSAQLADFFLPDMQLAILNLTFPQETEITLDVSLDILIDGWGNDFILSYWVDMYDCYFDWPSQTIDLKVELTTGRDDFWFIPEQNMDEVTTATLRSAKWVLTDWITDNEVAVQFHNYDYVLPTFDSTDPIRFWLLPIVVIVIVFVIIAGLAYKFLDSR